MDDSTSQRQRPEKAGATAAELLRVGSDGSSVPFTMRLEPSGELSYSALTPMMQFLGLSDGEIGLATFMSRMEQTAEDLAVQRRMFERSASDSEVVSFERRFPDGDGHPQWIRFVALPARQPSGAIAWSGVMRDIIIGKPVVALRGIQPSAETNGCIRATVASKRC